MHDTFLNKHQGYVFLFMCLILFMYVLSVVGRKRYRRYEDDIYLVTVPKALMRIVFPFARNTDVAINQLILSGLFQLQILMLLGLTAVHYFVPIDDALMVTLTSIICYSFVPLGAVSLIVILMIKRRWLSAVLYSIPSLFLIITQFVPMVRKLITFYV